MLSSTNTNNHKPCISCGEVKPLGDYHSHKMMRDGCLNKCKACVRAYMKSRHRAKRVYLLERSADNYRLNRAKIRERQADYNKTEAGKASMRASNIRWMAANPEKRAAHLALGSAIRTGRLVKPDECSMCGADGRIHGHHHDYSQPLSVIWCCQPCHIQIHKGEVA